MGKKISKKHSFVTFKGELCTIRICYSILMWKTSHNKVIFKGETDNFVASWEFQDFKAEAFAVSPRRFTILDQFEQQKRSTIEVHVIWAG